MPQHKTILSGIRATGRLHIGNYLGALKGQGHTVPRLQLGHAIAHDLGPGLPTLISSYHPSRQNTNTGKLTVPMFDRVFARARRLLD